MHLLLFTILTKAIGKPVFRIYYLRGTIPHSSSLFLLFSFSLFSVMSLISFPHILHSTFPIYISLPWLALLHFMRVRLFFFHFFSILSLVKFTMHNKQIPKEAFCRMPKFTWILQIFFFKLKVEIEHTVTENLAP